MDVQVPNGVVDVPVADEARSRRRGPAVPVVLPGPVDDVDRARPGAAAPGHPRQPAARLRRARGHRRARRRRFGARAAPQLRPRHGDGPGPHRGPAGRRRRQQPGAPGRARSTPTEPTRRPGSCSCATPSTCRCSCCATRPGSWSDPRPSRPALVRHVSRLFVTGSEPDGADVHDRAPQGIRPRRPGHGRRQLPGPVVHGRLADRRARGMGLEGAVRLGYRKELEAVEDPAERERAVGRDGRAACTSRARR